MKYEIACTSDILQPTPGTISDWVYGEAGIPYSFIMELRDIGGHGFILPPDQIIPIGEEVMAFHVSIAEQMIKEYEH